MIQMRLNSELDTNWSIKSRDEPDECYVPARGRINSRCGEDCLYPGWLLVVIGLGNARYNSFSHSCSLYLALLKDKIYVACLQFLNLMCYIHQKLRLPIGSWG